MSSKDSTSPEMSGTARLQSATAESVPAPGSTPAPVSYGATEAPVSCAPAAPTDTAAELEGGPTRERRDSIGEWHPEYDALFREAKPPYQYYITVASALFLVFSSMTTLGTFAASFQNSVPTSVRDRHSRGPVNFTNMCAYLRWMPMFYGALCFLVFSNTAAELVFYTSLRRGKITVIPSLQSARDIFCNPLQVFFVIVTVGYGVSAIIILHTLEAATGVIIGFLTTLAMGAGAQWVRLMLAPAYFLSLSDYIGLFPNSQGQPNACDNVSRDEAVKCLSTVDVRTSRVGDIAGDWRMLRVSRTAMTVLGVTVVLALVALVLAGTAIASASKDVQKENWGEINPCVEACYDTTVALAPSASSKSICTSCICKCSNSFGFIHAWLACKVDITIASCADHCPASCPQHTQ